MGEHAGEVWDAVRGALSASRRGSPIERGPRAGNLPLSFVQEGIWLHEQLYPDSGAYNTTLALELIGSFDIAFLQSALSTVVRRHDILRTCFSAKDGLPFQQISDDVPLHVGVVDLGQLSAEEGFAEVRHLALAENMKPFDLQRPPLWRFTLLRFDDAAHVLLMAVHHLIWDQSSYSLFLDELITVFADSIGEKTSPRQDLEIQYADFARWEREQAEAGRLRPHVEYWKKNLEGCFRHLELPVDKPQLPVPTFAGRSRWFQLEGELGAGLKELSRDCETTLFMTFLAAFAAMLARYGNDSDIVIATPFSKRQRRELMPMIGPLINLLLLRFDVRGNPTARQLLQRVRKVVLDGYAHQDAPYEQVLAAAHAERDHNGRPPVQAMFTFYRMPWEITTARGLEIKPFDVEDGKARLNLELFVWESPDGLHGRFIFNADIFDGATMDRITMHFQNLLTGMAIDPGCRLLDLPLLTPEEEDQLLFEWSSGPGEDPSDALIHELFGAQVMRAPEAPALVSDGQVMTYGEVNTRADRLAGHLRRRGVGVGSVVATHLERSPQLIIALLAILKLGGAYVSLDLADPPRRTSLMLADSGAELLLTTSSRRERLSHPEARTVLLDEMPDSDVKSTPGDTDDRVHLTHFPHQGFGEKSGLAYVTYTSGSTGVPKGIAVPHRAVIDMVCDVDYLVVEPGDRMAQAANISFDVATSEIWGALLNGGTLVILPRETILSPTALAATLEEQRIDTLFLTTALFNRVASEVPYAFRGLRDLLVGGEVLESSWVNRVLAHGAPARLLNVYGPTEATVYSTWFRVGNIVKGISRIPIGRPIGRKRVYVLDAGMKPVPVGVAGEIYIGGPGLASGYLGRKELTARQFVPDPFAAEEGGRLYRTGDRGRFLADGNLEFLERIDSQVKIRGHRIELGEIEAALALHPKVSECAVTVNTVPARGGMPEDKRLVAFVVPTQEQAPDVGDLRRFLKQRLPQAMLPSTFVPIEGIPLTATGKIDRRTLTKLGRRRQRPTQTSIVPHNEIEQKLAEIWKRVLWLDHDIGIHDDFFDLGGHSLLAAVLVAEVEKALDTKIPISALFRLSTVSELAGHLEPMIGALSETLARGLTNPDPEEAAKPYRLSDGVFRRLLAFTAGWKGERVSPDGGLMVGLNIGGHKPPLFWCFQGSDEMQQLARHLGESQPTFGMRSGHLAMQVTAENIRALAVHYVGEILAVEADGPYLVGGNCQGAYIAWAIAEELRRQGRPVALLSMQLMDYRHALPYGGRAALFFGSEFTDPFHAPDVQEPAWHELFPGGFSVDAIPGTHLWHFAEPHIQDFAQKIACRLEEALAVSSGGSVVSVGHSTTPEPSRGVVVLGMRGAGPSAVTGLLAHLWGQAPKGEAFQANKEVSEIHDDFFKALGRKWHDPEPLSDGHFRGEAAIRARVRLREVAGELAIHDRWVVGDPRMCRLLPLWNGLLPANVEVHFLHVFRSPSVVADSLQSSHGFPREKSLFMWLMHYLDAEVATRGRQRSWLHFEKLASPSQGGGADVVRAASGPVELFERRFEKALEMVLGNTLSSAVGDTETAPDGMRFQPWVATAYRALIGLSEGREIESRVMLDALRFGLDDEKRSQELDRVQEENDRLREKNHHVWRESVRVGEENDRLREKNHHMGQESIRVREEIDRSRGENDRLREKNHHMGQESIRVREEIDRSRGENDRLGCELDVSLRAREEARDALRHAEIERELTLHQLWEFQQRKSWKLMAPLRRIYSVVRNGRRSG